MFISIPCSSSSKTDLMCISCCVFDIGGFTHFSFLEKSNSLFVVSSSHDGLWCSLHDLVKLFVLIPTSPRSSKSESGWKNYCRSSTGRIWSSGSTASPAVLPLGTNSAHNGHFSGDLFKGTSSPKESRTSWARFSPLSPPLLTFGKACLPLNPSHDSCISLREKWEEI